MGLTLGCFALSEGQTPVSVNRAPSEKVQEKLRQRGTLILRDASLIEALFAIKENWGINIVVGNDVQGAVNGAYTNAPLHEILDSILASHGYGYVAIGDSLVVMKLEYLGSMKPLFVAETIPLEHVPPEEVVNVIEFLLSPHGKAHAVPSSKSVVVLDYPERIRVVRERIAELDRAAQAAAKAHTPAPAASPAAPQADRRVLVAETFPLEYASPEETARVIELLLSPEGKARAATSARAILVVDYPDRLESVRARVAELEQAAAAHQARERSATQTSEGQSSSSSTGQKPAESEMSSLTGASGSAAPGRSEPPSAEPLAEATATPAPLPQPAPPDLSPPTTSASSGLSTATNAASPRAGQQRDLVLNPEEFEVAFFAPQYVRVTAIVDALSTLVGPYGQVTAVPEENRIVVVDQPPYIRRMAAAVEKLDVPRRQVRIAAMIFDASLTDLENIGINWQHAVKGRNLTADGAAQDLFQINSLTLPNPAAGAVNGAITFMSLSQHFDVTAVINALRTSRNSRLLADPTVVVSDQESAKISIVTEIPYQQLTESALGGVIGTTAFREAGVTLEVTPHIARDGTVNMIVTPKFSVLTGFTEQDNQPIIAKREAQTVVRVANNQTLVIGGLRQRGRVQDRSAIPYLSDIKFLGHLFRQRSDELRESELLVFLTPTILEAGVFGTIRERAAYEAGQCEVEQVRQEPCVRCVPPEDRTLYNNDFFGPPPVTVEPSTQPAALPHTEIYRLPPTSGPAQEATSQHPAPHHPAHHAGWTPRSSRQRDQRTTGYSLAGVRRAEPSSSQRTDADRHSTRTPRISENLPATATANSRVPTNNAPATTQPPSTSAQHVHTATLRRYFDLK